MYQFAFHGVRNKHKHQWDRPGCIPQVTSGTVPHADQDIDIQRNEFGRHAFKLFGYFIGESMFKCDVAAFGVAESSKAIRQCVEIWPFFLSVCRVPKNPDCRKFSGLLRARRERPRRRTTEQRDELPPLHSITSLAAETKSGESASPRAWAVRRLMTKSNCEVALMGRSPGLAPRRIRST